MVTRVPNMQHKKLWQLDVHLQLQSMPGQNTSNDVDVKDIYVDQLQIVCAACVSADCMSHLTRSWCYDRSRIPGERSVTGMLLESTYVL